MVYHICHNSLPSFNSIFNYKIENYGKRKDEVLNKLKLNSLCPGNKAIWKTKYITFNIDRTELNNFPSEKLEALKRNLYSIPGLGNEEDFVEYQYHYYDSIRNNKIKQNNFIQFDEEQNKIKEYSKDETFNTSSLGDINEYPLLNPSFYIPPSIVSSVHISLLTSQIKIKYNPDFTNPVLLRNIILQSGLNILEEISSSCVKVTYHSIANKRISTTTYGLPSHHLSENGNEIEINNGSDDSFVSDFLNNSEIQEQEQDMIMSSTKFQNKYNKSALLELFCFSDEHSCKNRFGNGLCNPLCKNCLQWLKYFISLSFFDQIDVQSIQFIKQPWIDPDNETLSGLNSNNSRFSMIFYYHESVESFIFDDLYNILNEVNIGIYKVHVEHIPFVNKEEKENNSLKVLSNGKDANNSTKKISLHSIAFVLPMLKRASEATYLESNLLKIPGVKGPIKFDFMKRQCTIIYNSYEISVKDIINEIKTYHLDASSIADSFHRLSKEEEKAILNLPINKTNDMMYPLDEICINNNDNKLVEIDQDEAETEICYNSESDDVNLQTTAKYANSENSSSSTEFTGNGSDNMNSEFTSNANTDYIELKNTIEKRSKNVISKRFIQYSKIEKCFSICSLLTILSFITPYLFVWINYITNYSYMRLNLHIECVLVFLLSLPVQFYYGSEIHSTAYNIIKTNRCECYYSNDDATNTLNKKSSEQSKYSECPLHSNVKKNHSLSRVVILSTITWIIWIYSSIGIFVRLLQVYTNENKYESSHIYHEYFETSSLFITCYYMKKLLELSTKQYTINNISQFMHLQMKKVILLKPLDPTLTNCNTINSRSLKTEWTESIVDVNSLKEGDIIKILPGSRIPYNGSIVYGKTKLDESMISGNTKPVTKSVAGRVISGTMNIESSIYVKILDATDDCTFYSMINFIEDVQLSKSSFHVFTDCIYKYLIPATFLISMITLFIWTFSNSSLNNQSLNDEFIKEHYTVEFGIIFAISVLIVAFPYTIEFTFPVAISIASKVAMKYGILVKDDALTFKKLSELDIVVFNKEQVITNGNPSVAEIVIDKNFNQFDKNEGFYEILKSLERYSTNVYAKCIRNYIKKVEMSLPDTKLTTWDVLYYHETEGYNIISKIRSPVNNVYDVYMGCEKWMMKQKCIPSMDQSRISIWTERGYSVIYIAINKVIVGMLGIHDNVRDGTKGLIQCLKEKYHIEPWLLSCDNENSTINTAKQIGIDESHCLYNVLPSEKQEKIKWLQNNYTCHTNNNKKRINPNFKLTNSSFEHEFDEYQEGTGRPVRSFNPRGSINVFSNYNVVAPVPSMPFSSSVNENGTQSQIFNDNDNDNNNHHSIQIHDDDYYLISQDDTKKNMVAYIGNDINDSEVFTTADIGICLGILNDISLDSSVITTIYQDVQCINKLLHLTKYIINYSYTTIIYILVLHLLLLPVASGLLYPYTWLNPIWIFINLVLNIIIHYYRAKNLKKINF